jgi:hypothetical protein
VLRAPAVDESVRSISAVLLRRVIIRDANSLWDGASDNTKDTLKRELLAHLPTEQNASTRKKICDVVGELGAAILEGGEWPELLPFMFAAVNGTDPFQIESALRIYTNVAYFLAQTMSAHFGMLASTFEKCLVKTAHPNWDRIQANAIQALGCVVMNLSRQSELEHFQHLVPGILQARNDLLAGGKSDSALEAVETLVDITSEHPTYFRKGLQQVVQAMLTVAACKELDQGIQHLALEFLVSMGERAPSTARKLPDNMFVKGARL